MKSLRGFIAVPVLIAIIASIIAVVSIAYIGVTKFQNKQNTNQINGSDSVSTSAGQASQTQIDKLKQEVDVLKQNSKPTSNTQNKLQPSTPQATINTAPKTYIPLAPPVVNPVAVLNNNLCKNTRNDYDSFEQQFNVIMDKISALIKIYNQTYTAPSNLDAFSSSQYLFTQASSEKDVFIQNVSTINDLVSKLPGLDQDKDNLVDAIKTNLQSAVNSYLLSFNLFLATEQSVVNNHSMSVLNAGIATLDSVNKAYVNAGQSLQVALNNFYSLKDVYDKALKTNNCHSLCNGGFALSNGQCIAVLPKIFSLTPFSGTSSTIFSASGADFGDTQSYSSGVTVGDKNVSIALWNNTTVTFVAGNLLPGLYTVRIKGVFAGNITITK